MEKTNKNQLVVKDASKENKATKENKIKLNINYVDFIKKVVDNNLLSKTKESLVEDYLTTVKVKSFRNIKRVSDRVKREELSNLLAQELKARKLELETFIKADQAVVNKISTKEKNYKAI